MFTATYQMDDGRHAFGHLDTDGSFLMCKAFDAQGVEIEDGAYDAMGDDIDAEEAGFRAEFPDEA